MATEPRSRRAALRGTVPLFVLSLLSPLPASAGSAEELAALFVQSCLPYAGRPAELRRWAASRKLPPVPDPARAAFLHGAPGQVFDASNASGKLVLVSSDDGICAVVTDEADGRATAAALEHTLTEAGATFRLVIERDDKQNPRLHHREYLAAHKGRGWRILAATERDAPGRAMLTAAPE